MQFSNDAYESEDEQYLESFLKCAIRFELLRNEPIFLLCTETVFSTHSVSTDSLHKCKICSRYHSVPEYGFPFISFFKKKKSNKN